MSEIFLDFETRSLLDLEEVGSDRYCREAEILMLGWAVDDEKVKIWQPHLEPFPEKLNTLLNDPENLLIAWNVAFERSIFKWARNTWFDFPRWRDVMVLARTWSLPGKLEKVCPILKMPPEESKADGDELIHFFSEPVDMGGRETLFGVEPPMFHDWNTHPEKWAKFVEYCKQDVVSERVLWRRLNKSPMPDLEWKAWFLDQKMNETGLYVNKKMAENALWLAEKSKEDLLKIIKEKTGLENPNSNDQMKEWVSARGFVGGSIEKKYVQPQLDNPESSLTPECREVLILRQGSSKNSYTKLEKLLQFIGPDNRLRYQFIFAGAGRTWRWAGSKAQPQNLPRPEKAVKKNFKQALQLIMDRAYEDIRKKYASVIGMVCSCLRMTFQCPPGKKMVISDLNAIENRALGFLARCPAILNVFKEKVFYKEEWQDKCPYCHFGTYLYGVPYEVLHAEWKGGNDERRQNSKAPVLGGGYALGGGEMYMNHHGNWVRGGLWGYALSNCGVDMPKELAHKAVDILRKAWPEVVQFWTDLEMAFKHVLKTGQPIRIGEVMWSKIEKKWIMVWPVVKGTIIEFDRVELPTGFMIRMHLPSGRCLHYLNAVIEKETVVGNNGKPWTREVIYYEGIEHSTTQDADGKTAKKNQKWGRVKTYGGKLTENAVQAFSRDLLVNGMFLADDMGFEIVGCFHDEIAALVDDDPWGLGVADLNQCMSESPSWAPGVPLGAEGFESEFYRKN